MECCLIREAWSYRTREIQNGLAEGFEKPNPASLLGAVCVLCLPSSRAQIQKRLCSLAAHENIEKVHLVPSSVTLTTVNENRGLPI